MENTEKKEQIKCIIIKYDKGHKNTTVKENMSRAGGRGKWKLSDK